MKRILPLALLFLLIAVSFPLVRADRGMIPISPGVSIYEPGQKAILAWNGQKEIMILSTDVTASEETQVLEILPLPSKPEVEAASFQAFEQIQSMIWQEGVNRFTFSSGEQARSGSVEIVFHTEIGAHNITVVNANNAAELVDWAGDFLRASGVDEEISLGDYESAVNSYMGRGFRYYVLDIVTFSPQESSLDAILYRFDSSFLYYPLIITNAVGGTGEIDLFAITKDKMNDVNWPMHKAMYQVNGAPWQPIEFALSRGDCSKIDLRIGEILPDGGWLTVLEFQGYLNSFTTDLMISETASPANVEVTFPTSLVVLCFLLGAASALGGTVTTLLITRSKKPTHALSTAT